MNATADPAASPAGGPQSSHAGCGAMRWRGYELAAMIAKLCSPSWVMATLLPLFTQMTLSPVPDVASGALVISVMSIVQEPSAVTSTVVVFSSLWISIRCVPE